MGTGALMNPLGRPCTDCQSKASSANYPIPRDRKPYLAVSALHYYTKR